MKLQITNYFRNHGLPPPISYKPDHIIVRNSENKANYLKLNIKTQPRDKDSKTVAIYVPLFRTGIPESLLKLVKILNNIIKGQDLSMGPQKYSINRDIFVKESLQLFEEKTWYQGTQTNYNNELEMNILITHFFSSKVLHIQKRYLCRGI